MKSKNTLIILHFIFATVFLCCISAAAIYFNKSGLMWWYLIPAITTFVTLILCADAD